MTTYKITYMVDPGDGIESTMFVDHESDQMIMALRQLDADGFEHFITKCEITDHDLMV